MIFIFVNYFIMKKLLTLGFALTAVALMAGCTNSQPTEEEAVAPVVEETPAVVEETPVVEATGTTEEAPVVATGAEVATGN